MEKNNKKIELRELMELHKERERLLKKLKDAEEEKVKNWEDMELLIH